MRRTLAPAMALLVAGCTPHPPAEPLEGSDAPWLEVAVSIGIDAGDDRYVFGDIQDAVLTADGRILVLDMLTHHISVYGRDGVFLDRIGGPGEGPGEFRFPTSMAVLEDGGILVTDPLLSRVTVFSQDLLLEREISGFVPFPPVSVTPGRGGSFIGSHRTFDRENSLYGHRVALWEESAEPSLIYYEKHVPFIVERLRECTTETLVAFASGYDGRVYIAPVSETAYRVEAFSPDGDLLWSLEENREARARAAEDIEREREQMERQLLREGAPPELRWEPAARSSLISSSGLGLDHRNRLWVRDGRETYPVFDVYEEGAFLFRAALADSSTTGTGLQVKVTTHGILAWEPDPEEHPRLFLLELKGESI